MQITKEQKQIQRVLCFMLKTCHSFPFPIANRKTHKKGCHLATSWTLLPPALRTKISTTHSSGRGAVAPSEKTSSTQHSWYPSSNRCCMGPTLNTMIMGGGVVQINVQHINGCFTPTPFSFTSRQTNTPGRERRPISSRMVKSQWNALRQGSCRS